MTPVSDDERSGMPHSSHRRPWALTALALLVGSCADGSHLSIDGTGGSSPTAASSRVPVAESVRVTLERGEPARVLILLDPSYQAGSDGGLATSQGAAVVADDDAGVADPTSAIADVQDAVLAAVPDGQIAEVHTYTHFPMLYATLNSPDALDALTAQAAVVEVYENRANFLQLSQSLSLIGQPTVAAQGKLGGGTSVAVLDTGTDFTRPAFGSCTAAGAPGCKVLYAQDFAPDDKKRDENGHGTNVAGIVLGVAPGAGVIALDVFQGASGPSNVILSAIDWVIANRARYNIVAMNLSLGSGNFSAACPNDVFAASLAAARSAGILPVVATGNAGSSTGIASPACVPAALSVGAVYDTNVGGLSFPGAGCNDATTSADQITCFTNSSQQLSMFAPGSSIAAAGYTMSGTSQATPHVAGAAAVLFSAFSGSTPESVATLLTTSGPLLTDARNGVARRRLDLITALSGSPPGDVTAPTGTVTINGGATATRSPTVTLAVSGSDAVGVTAMCISATDTCTGYVPYAASATFTLPKGDGPKSVRVLLKDAVGNVSAPIVTSIVLDSGKPTDGKLTVTPGDGQIALTVTGAKDKQVGALTYVVVAAAGAKAPASCDAGTKLYEGTSASPVLSSLANGTTLSLRVCVRDEAGNTSKGVTISSRPAPEFAAPTGSVSIAGGATYTRTPSVTLSITASDASGVAQMCVSGTAKCTAWVPFADTATVKLAKSSGVATAYVFLRDVYGNATVTPITDTIIVDAGAPSVSALTAVPGSGKLTLSWAAKDSTTGIASYTLVYAAGTKPPASCSAGTVLYTGASTSFEHTGLASGKHAYRACATDGAGNSTTGRSFVATLP
jgi:subtilisin family serine protease